MPSPWLRRTSTCSPDPHDCSNTTAATNTATPYAAKNNISTSQMSLQFLCCDMAEVASPSVTPISSRSSRSSALARRTSARWRRRLKDSPGGVPGAIPFGVTQATIDAAGTGNPVTLKYDASGGSISGNFGAIDIDGTGSPPYEVWPRAR